MTLFTRFARLFRADVHAVLDQAEDPLALLKQAIREMEEDLAQDRQRMRGLLDERTRLDARITDLQSNLAGTGDDLEVCFTSGDDDLARTVIRRQLETRQLLSSVGTQRLALQQRIVDLEERVRENGARLVTLRQRADHIESQRPSGGGASNCSHVELSTPAAVRDEEVEVAFLREKRRFLEASKAGARP